MNDATPDDFSSSPIEPDEASLVDQARTLVELFQNVGQSVNDLSERVEVHQRLINRSHRRWKVALVLTMIGLVLDFSLTVIGLQLYLHERDNTQTISEIQQRTSAKILCPVWGLFIESIKANPQGTNLTSAEVTFRKTALVTIEQGYTILGCPPLQ